MKINWQLVLLVVFGILYIWVFTAMCCGAVWIVSNIVKGLCFRCISGGRL